MASTELEYTFTGKLSDDCETLLIDNAYGLKRLLSQLKDHILEINIKKFYKNRSLAQNSWMWGVCIPTIRAWMKENTGECPSKEAMYAYLRISIVGQNVIIEEVAGVEVPIVSGKRFSKMTTVEFSDAVEKIVAYYAEQDLEIPLPIPGTNNLITDYLNRDVTDI